MGRDLAVIISNFRIKGTYMSGSQTGSGHINDSYLIYTKEPEAPEYILQRINNSIFKNIDGLMENYIIVTRHLKEKQGPGKNESQLLEVIPAKDGKPCFVDETGNYWRVLNYIKGGHVYDIVTDPEIAYEGGKAFGLFLRDIADIPVESILETIPNFHNVATRLDNFYKSVKADRVNRLKCIEKELEFIRCRIDEMLAIPRLQSEGLIPQRITHNDTKFNNIIFDASNKAICVVDLDTIMTGSALFDFGDAIRSGANTAAEDEPDLNKVTMSMDIFEAYARGYLESTFDLLTATEINMLAFSARFITFVIGLRFLTDYIDGDIYYRTNYPDHNLVRAKVQFKLVESMEQQFKIMQNCVNTIANKLKS
jgi:Ser/Thr protein kinase RdoA (MazF antagonist)